MWRLVISSYFYLNLQVRKCVFQPCNIMTDSVLSSVIRKQMPCSSYLWKETLW